jgi:hypothetical protein
MSLGIFSVILRSTLDCVLLHALHSSVSYITAYTLLRITSRVTRFVCYYIMEYVPLCVTSCSILSCIWHCEVHFFNTVKHPSFLQELQGQK